MEKKEQKNTINVMLSAIMQGGEKGEFKFYHDTSTLVYMINHSDFRQNIRIPFNSDLCFEVAFLAEFFKRTNFRKLNAAEKYKKNGTPLYLYEEDLNFLVKKYDLTSKKSEYPKRVNNFLKSINAKEIYKMVSIPYLFLSEGKRSRRAGYVFYKDFCEKIEEKTI